jgi:CspA family cold shock protein
MYLGTTLFYDRIRGYGFIIPADHSEDLFFHHTGIVMDGIKRLEKGQAVSYELSTNPRTNKPMAVNVTPIASEVGGDDERNN